MPEPIDLPAAKRAERDRELNNLVDWLLSQAAERDHLDVLEASTDLAGWLGDRLTRAELAASAAALAIRLHRTATDRFGQCVTCNRIAQWVPASGPFAGRWCHLDPRKPYHRPEVKQ